MPVLVALGMVVVVRRGGTLRQRLLGDDLHPAVRHAARAEEPIGAPVQEAAE